MQGCANDTGKLIGKVAVLRMGLAVLIRFLRFPNGSDSAP